MKTFSNLIAIATILIISSGCAKNVQISIKSLSEKKDSIIIQELITEKTIFKFSTNNKEIKFKINEPTVVSFNSENSPQRNNQLGILYNGKKLEIRINSKGVLSSTNLADSLLQYLFSSNNLFIGENQNEIFNSNNPSKTLNIFTQFLEVRDSILVKNKSKLTSIESKILDFQNHARIYSFLFYYGRIIQDIEPKSTFWTFINEIDNNSQLNKSLPHNVLYKYEIEYLKKHDSIKSISDFVVFIENNTANKDLTEYLKAIYIHELISSPSYWQRHYQLFNSVTMHEILKKEENNPYNYIFKATSNNYFASQQGMAAYNFSGLDLNGKTFQLSDFLGKYVVIDVWATWCGACINQRPFFTEVAKKFQTNKDIQFVAISVDSSIKEWQNYLTKNGNTANIIDINVKDGMKTEFGNQYSINFIPKYILIDKEGKIVDANMQNPSIALESILNKELTR